MLRNALDEQEFGLYEYGSSIAKGLGRIAPGTRSADAAVAILIETLDFRPRIREMGSEALNARLEAIEALSAFGPRAAGAVPRLRAWLDDPDGRLSASAALALEAIERSGSTGGDRAR